MPQRTPRPFLLAALLLVFTTGAVPAAPLTPQAQPSSIAVMVFGQGGDFTTAAVNKGGTGGKPTAGSLFLPGGAAADPAGGLYIADTYNNRVVYYAAGGSSAARVYGQAGSFTTNTSNKGAASGAASADSLSAPQAAAVDSAGSLYIADTGNHRVLFFGDPSHPTTATRVYGQAGSFTAADPPPTVDASTLFSPTGLAVDTNGGLYVADTNNNRVLFYPAGSTTPTRVYGQGGSFTSSAVNKDGLNQDGLNYPAGIAVDLANNLYVADQYNNRVLFFLSGSTTPTRVYGQNGSFTSDGIACSAAGLSQPMGVALDPGGSLYTADAACNRAVVFLASLTAAAGVYGQNSSLATGYYNLGGSPSENSLANPSAAAFGPDGTLYLVDTFNNRVLGYTVPVLNPSLFLPVVTR
jgi:sugar lactone lactonase YvrE